MTDAPTLSRQPVKAEEPAKRWRNLWLTDGRGARDFVSNERHGPNRVVLGAKVFPSADDARKAASRHMARCSRHPTYLGPVPVSP